MNYSFSLLSIIDDTDINDYLIQLFNKNEKIHLIEQKFSYPDNILNLDNIDCIIIGQRYEEQDTFPIIKRFKELNPSVIILLYFDFMNSHNLQTLINTGVDYYFSRDQIISITFPDRVYSILNERVVPKDNSVVVIQTQKDIGLADKNEWIIEAFINNENSLISIRDYDGRYILANKAFQNLFNISVCDFSNKTDLEIFSDINADQLGSAHRKIIASGKTLNIDTTFKTIKGVRHYMASFFPIFDDAENIVMTGMIASDITRIKEMESGLKRGHMELIRSFEDLARTEEELEEKYRDLLVKDQEIRDIFDNMHDVFYRVDKDGFIKMMSPSASFMFGYSSHLDLIDKKMDILWADPEQRLLFVKKLLHSGYIHDYEFIAIREDGSKFWVSSSVRLLTKEEEHSSCYEGIIRDISERKAFEDEKQAMLSQIEKNLGELAILNDGIRNPLTIILGYSSIFPSDICDKIKIQVKKIDDMVFQLDKQWNRSSHVLHFINRHYGYNMEIKEKDGKDIKLEDE